MYKKDFYHKKILIGRRFYTELFSRTFVRRPPNNCAQPMQDVRKGCCITYQDQEDQDQEDQVAKLR